MENDAIVVSQMGGEAHDLSMIGLFVQADIVVQIVMIVLILASFWSWAIIIDKIFRFRRMRTTSRMSSGPAAIWKTCTAASERARIIRWPCCLPRQ